MSMELCEYHCIILENYPNIFLYQIIRLTIISVTLLFLFMAAIMDRSTQDRDKIVSMRKKIQEYESIIKRKTY